MAYNDEVRTAVRSAFIFKGMSLQAACDFNNVSYETGRSWKRKAKSAGDDWDISRAASSISKSGIQTLTASIIEDFVVLFQSTIEEVKASENMSPMQKAESISRLSDAYTKTVKAAGNSSPALSRLAVAMDILKRQSEFIQAHFPEHINAFTEILEPFGEVISREFT